MSWFGDPSYGITRRLPGTAYKDAVPVVKEALAKEGFGVLTEIDVKATLKKKIDVDMAPYVILGACNPPLAHKALTADPQIGLLLPCNVIVYQGEDGSVTVSLVRPDALFSLVDDPGMSGLMGEVSAALKKAHDAIAG